MDDSLTTNVSPNASAPAIKGPFSDPETNSQQAQQSSPQGPLADSRSPHDASPVSHYLPSDDRSTAAAAASAADGTANVPQSGVEAINGINADIGKGSVPFSNGTTIREGPGHEADLRGLNGNGVASAVAGSNGRDVKASDSQESKESKEASLKEDGQALEVAEGIAKDPSSIPAASSLSAPGSSNPYNESEEKSMESSLPLPSTQATTVASEDVRAESEKKEPPSDIQMDVDQPAPDAVDPSKDAILSPVKVDGESRGDPIDLQKPAMSSIDEPQPKDTKIEDSALPMTNNAGDVSMSDTSVAPKVEEVAPVSASGQDGLAAVAQTGLEDGGQPGKAEQVAPALAGLGGVSGPSAITDAAAAPVDGSGLTRPAETQESGQEPPAKRQRQTSSVDPGKQPLAGPDATKMTAAQIKFCQNIIKSLKGRPDSLAFVAPVNPEQLGIPHYRTIINEPMDLGTVDIKLALTAAASKGGQKHTDKTKQADKWNLDPLTDVYETSENFEKDVRQVFQNCFTFNGPDHPLSLSAQNLQNVFDKQLKTMPSSEPPSASAVVEGTSSMPPTPGDASTGIAGRRPSDGLTSRPKREVHPPAPKDLPWADQPQAAGGTGSKKKKSKKPLTPRQQAYVNKKNKDQLRYCAKLIDQMYKPPVADFAWPFFAKPEMGLDFAEAYYQEIKRPISLKEIKNAITINQYEDVEDVQSDMELLFANCFQFNPPGTDVYVMGDKLKSFWNDKLKKLPQPPEPAEDEEEEEEEEEEEDDSQIQARAIRDQIELLQMQLQGLEGNSKAAGAKALASAKATLAALPAKKGQRRPSEGGTPAKKKSSGNAGGGASGGGGGSTKKSKSSTSSSAGAAGEGAATKKAAPKPKKSSAGKKRDDDVRDVTYEQKEELATKITQLSDEALEIALKIIAEDKPPSANEDEEIELDIDDLSPGTLYKLYRHVVRPKGPKKPVADKANAVDGRKRGTGGVKRKNLDEGEEAARIARLQAQLQQFDNPNAAQGSGAPSAGAHDDLVASDSSSGEDESDSESDYE